MNISTTVIRLSFFAVFACSLVACGGGGSSTSSPNPVATDTTFPLKAAYTDYLTKSRSLPVTVKGVVSGVDITGTGTLTLGNLTAAVFEGTTGFKKTTSVIGNLIGTKDGQSINLPLASSEISYFDSNYVPIGNVSDSYSVVSGGANVPASVKVNDSGLFYTQTTYSSSSKLLRTGTTTTNYVVQPDTQNTAMLVLISVTKDTTGVTVSNTTITYRLTAVGTLTPISETAVQNSTGLSLTLTYQN
jgi:hypothetical protein